MNQEKLIKLCDWLIDLFILGTIFIMPLFFSTQTYFTFEVNKAVLFRIIVELMLLLFSARVLLAGKLNVKNGKLFYYSLLLILVTQLVSTIFSEHQLVAFWGTAWRSDGFFSTLHLLFFSWLFFQYYDKNRLTLNNLFYTITASGFLVSVYGILQISGHDFLAWQEISTNYLPRANSTLGQPNYLASYLLLIIPVVFCLFRYAKNFKQKMLWLIILFVEFWALLVTYSRSAWLGLIFGLVVFGLIYLFKKHKKLFSIVLILLTVLIGFYFYISFYKPIKIEPDNNRINLTYRLSSLFNVYQGSSILRLHYYSTALKIIKSAPWIGHGLDTQTYYFSKYYEPRDALFEAIYTIPDRAHNQVLDILITSGLLGMLAWLFLCFLILKRSFDYLKVESENGREIKCLLFALLSFGFSLMFGFFSIVLSVYFWFFVPLMFSIFYANKKVSDKLIKIELKNIIAGALFFSLAFFVGYFSWQHNFKLELADYYYRRALAYRYASRYQEAVTNFNQVISLAPTEAVNTYYGSQTIGFLLTDYSSLEFGQERVASISSLEDLVTQNSKDGLLNNRFQSAAFYDNLARAKFDAGEDIKKIEEYKIANNLFASLTKNEPNFAYIYFYWGNMFFSQGDYKNALNKYYKALSLYPDLNNPDLNQEHYDLIVNDKLFVYKQVVQTNIVLNDFVRAKEICEEALRLRPVDQGLVSLLAKIYLYDKSSERAVDLYQHQIMLSPMNSQLYYQLAIVYRVMGHVEKAKESIEKAIKLDPKKEYFDFLDPSQSKKTYDFINLGFK